ncbi:MAG TPA: hypothetical protein VK638_43180, partial [Edaphobacter sp.]|nr:hypothetical protein [Edaphobacter sp.]
MKQRLDAERASRSTPPLSALALSLFMLPEDKPKYQAYNGRFDTSSGQSSQVYPKHFLAYYGCLMSEVDNDGRFWCWMLPDTAKVAKGFPGMISFDPVSPESKYDSGKSARQLWERTLNWKMEVAPLCHAGKLPLDAKALWSRFTPVDVSSFGTVLNSVLPDLKVTQ